MKFIGRSSRPPQIPAAGGEIIMEFGSGRRTTVRDLIMAGGEFAEPEILSDHQGIDRPLVAVRK